MSMRIILFLALVMISCQEDKIIETGLKGTLIGFVQTNISNATVGEVAITVEGTFPEITVKSDAEGKFVIENLQTGTYNLVCKKSGYGTFKVMGFSFIGGSVPGNVWVFMAKLPNVKVKELNITIGTPFPGTRRIEGTALVDVTQSLGWSSKFRYYMSKTSDVSPSNYDETGIVTATGSSNPVKFFKDINTVRFEPGSDLYFVIYPCVEENLGYIDLETGNMIYSSIDLDGSQVKVVKVPL